ncbi:MAG: AAA family ATPase, partial [Firmicutes bacterium]|nr:AAA family ATPase [Candidatus Colimorpha enterica]
EYTKLDSKRENLTTEHDRLAEKIWEDYELTYSAAVELNYAPITAEMKPEYSKRQTELRNKLRALGSVNVGAIEEYAEVKEKYEFNKAQYDDLTQARESLNGIIDRLEREMKVRFTTAFEDINRNFKVTFKELFGGGNAEILLADPENVLESGIEINVAPPGKIINNLISLSGGEQAFVAIALIFAILNVNPTPFCIFDEIESALDEVNVIRLAEYMKRYSEKTQFVVITHRRGTMEASDMLYGITMPDRGISKVLSMNVNEVEQKIGEKYV